MIVAPKFSGLSTTFAQFEDRYTSAIMLRKSSARSSDL
jgi:hypothetical protein